MPDKGVRQVPYTRVRQHDVLRNVGDPFAEGQFTLCPKRPGGNTAVMAIQLFIE